MNRIVTSIKRELWEHHSSLVKLPAILVILFTVLLIISSVTLGKMVPKHIDTHLNVSSFQTENQFHGRQFKFEERVIGDIEAEQDEHLTKTPEFNEFVGYSLSSPYIVLHRIMLIVTLTYLLTCLNSDRRDNSILFWKSMPVSETENVGLKLGTGLFVIPAITWCASLVLSVFILVAQLSLAVMSPLEGLAAQIWANSSVIGTAWQYSGTFLALSLWALPIWAWAMFASAVSKKNVFLSAALPLLVLIIAEAMAFKTSYTTDFLFQHASGLIPEAEQFMFLDAGWQRVLDVLAHPRFLASLPFCVMLLYGAIWLRENRFEV